MITRERKGRKAKMNYAKLGRTGLYVSKLCLGTMNFGCSTEKKEAFRIMDAALEVGINFFDTANNYGFLIEKEGITETIIGEWFSQGGGRREQVILATKVHEAMRNPYDGPNGEKGLSIYKVRRHFEESLKRLQTDHVEIYYMHHIDRCVTWEETWDVFQNLYDRGKIDYIGASNFPAYEIARAQGEAKARHFMGISVEQDQYNLNNRLPELEVLPACRELGIGFVAWGPLAGGLLAGKSENSVRRNSLNSDNISLTEKYHSICSEAGMKEADVSLAWLLNNSVVTAPIIGARTLKQFEDSLKALEVKLPEDMLKELDKLFVGPGGEAPEVYAW